MGGGGGGKRGVANLDISTGSLGEALSKLLGGGWPLRMQRKMLKLQNMLKLTFFAVLTFSRVEDLADVKSRRGSTELRRKSVKTIF